MALVQGAVALVLATANLGGWINAGVIYACVFAAAIGQTFQNPAMRSLLPSLVGIELLPRCIAFHAAAKKAAIIVGPALGGAIYLAGASTAYATSAIAFVVAGALILCIRSTHVPRARSWYVTFCGKQHSGASTRASRKLVLPTKSATNRLTGCS